MKWQRLRLAEDWNFYFLQITCLSLTQQAVRTEMERGFSMRVAAEKEIAERHRVNEMRIQQEVRTEQARRFHL